MRKNKKYTQIVYYLFITIISGCIYSDAYTYRKRTEGNKQFFLLEKHRKYHEWLKTDDQTRGFLSFIHVSQIGLSPMISPKTGKNIKSMNMAAAIVFDEESNEGIDLGDLIFDHLPLDKHEHDNKGIFYTRIKQYEEDAADSLVYRKGKTYEWKATETEDIYPFIITLESPDDIKIISPKQNSVISIEEGLRINWTVGSRHDSKILIQLIPVLPDRFRGGRFYANYDHHGYPRRTVPPNWRYPFSDNAFYPPELNTFVKILEEDNGSFEIHSKELKEHIRWNDLLCVVSRVVENRELQDQGIIARMTVEASVRIRIE